MGCGIAEVIRDHDRFQRLLLQLELSQDFGGSWKPFWSSVSTYRDARLYFFSVYFSNTAE
jgi:hypothetical protein